MTAASLDPGTPAGRAALRDVALEAAREAAALVAPAWRTSVRADRKGTPIDLVTVFDRQSEALLRERLHAKTPFVVVGEEEGADGAATRTGARWFVDPIDGTTNFVHGHPFWCVSVGLVLDDEPIVGAIVAPALAPMGGLRRWRGDTQRRAVPRQRGRGVHRLAPRDRVSYDRRTSPDNNFEAFVAIKKQCQAVRRCGSAALDCAFVADGTYDGYWEKKLARGTSPPAPPSCAPRAAASPATTEARRAWEPEPSASSSSRRTAGSTLPCWERSRGWVLP